MTSSHGSDVTHATHPESPITEHENKRVDDVTKKHVDVDVTDKSESLIQNFPVKDDRFYDDQNNSRSHVIKRDVMTSHGCLLIETFLLIFI